MHAFLQATLEKEEADKFYQFVRNGHLAQDENYPEELISTFTGLCPEGYEVTEVKLSMKKIDKNSSLYLGDEE